MSASGSVLATLSNELAGAVATASRSVVAIHARRRIPTSGVIWRPGVVVATHHTIRREEDIEVTLPDGSRTPATLLGRDPGTDLAVLKAPGAKTPANWGTTDDLTIGNLVLAVGRPGDDATASLGVVSAVGPEWRTWHGGRIDRFVRLDVAVYDGFSGSALVDAGGRTVGVNTSGLARAAAVTIPAATINRVASQILEHGGVQYGYLGLGFQPVRLPAGAVAGRDQAIGLMVVSLEPGAPAASSGVLMGDILIGLDGTPVTNPESVFGQVRSANVGQTLELEVLRGGEVRTIAVKAGSRA